LNFTQPYMVFDRNNPGYPIKRIFQDLGGIVKE